MRALFPSRGVIDRLGNLSPLPEIYPDQSRRINRSSNTGALEKVMTRRGLPSPPQFHSKSGIDRSMTNLRNTTLSHWKGWLGPEYRCLVPLTQFTEPAGRGEDNVWVKTEDDLSAFFTGINVSRGTLIHNRKDGERRTTSMLF